ncbi:MAG: hypothetical protein ACR2IF_13720 [Terriglobales bacterium]
MNRRTRRPTVERVRWARAVQPALDVLNGGPDAVERVARKNFLATRSKAERRELKRSLPAYVADRATNVDIGRFNRIVFDALNRWTEAWYENRTIGGTWRDPLDTFQRKDDRPVLWQRAGSHRDSDEWRPGLRKRWSTEPGDEYATDYLEAQPKLFKEFQRIAWSAGFHLRVADDLQSRRPAVRALIAFVEESFWALATDEDEALFDALWLFLSILRSRIPVRPCAFERCKSRAGHPEWFSDPQNKGKLACCTAHNLEREKPRWTKEPRTKKWTYQKVNRAPSQTPGAIRAREWRERQKHKRRGR